MLSGDFERPERAAEPAIVPSRVARTVGVLAATVVALLLLRYEGDVFFLVLAGVLFAIALNAGAAWLAPRLHVPLPAAVGLLAALLVAAGGAFVWLLGPELADQLQRLGQQLPDALHTLARRVQHEPWYHQMMGPEPAESAMRPEPQSVLTGARWVARGALALFASTIVVFFLGVYGAARPRDYTRAIVLLVPPEKRPRAEQVLAEIGDNLRRWLLGRLVAMVFVGVLTALTLWLLGIPLALSLGVIAGLLTFVEYVGAYAAGAPVALVALTKGPIYVLWVVLLFTFVHVLEGYVLTPLLARKTVHFPPGYTLAAQVLLAAIFGPLGLTFATPIGVVVILLVQRLYVEGVLGDTHAAGGAKREDPRPAPA